MRTFALRSGNLGHIRTVVVERQGLYNMTNLGFMEEEK